MAVYVLRRDGECRGGADEPPGTLHMVRRCKLDPNLKAPGFQRFNLMKINLAFNLNLVSELAPLQHGGRARPAVRERRQDVPGKAVQVDISLTPC